MSPLSTQTTPQLGHSTAGTSKARSRTARKAPQSQHKLVLGGSGIVGFLCLWEVVSRSGLVNADYLPPASAVLLRLGADLGTLPFWTAIGETLYAWILGLAIAIAAAVIAGFGIGSSAFLKKFSHSTIEFLRPIPSVALIPLAVLLYGARLESTLLLVVYAAFWPVLIQVLYGIADVDKVANDTAKSFGLGLTARIRYVVWPTALPYLITGIRLSAAVGLILAVTAELIIGSPGLGREIAVAQAGGAITEMYALVLATGLLGVVINSGLRLAERKALAWHISTRTDGPE